MSKEYHLEVYGHPSIYGESQRSERKLRIYFSEPDPGVNGETGILLLIPGFGAHAQSRVYQKMRSLFADQYNLVTVQCDYFGYEFMQDHHPFNLAIPREALQKTFTRDEVAQIVNDQQLNIDRLLDIGSKYDIAINGQAQIAETPDYFNDMGIMQALDCLTAVLMVIAVIKDNQMLFNTKKILLYGHSHGAYLAYLCNAFAPQLFSLLIDNSAWLFPVYVTALRLLPTMFGRMKVVRYYDYLARSLAHDQEILSLPLLYKSVANQCRVICYQGATDQYINPKDKQDFCSAIGRCDFREITADKVDGDMIRSTDHGLGADFLKLFDSTMKDAVFASSNEDVKLPPVSIRTGEFEYVIDYANGVPTLQRTRLPS